MKTDIENNEWKAEAPYLANLPKVNPFSVPEHYFNTLPDLIHNSVFAEELKKKIPVSGFSVPDQYFNHSAEQFFNVIRDRISAETAEEPIVDLPKETGFSTPDLYFQNLQASILAKTTGAQIAEQSPALSERAQTTEASPLTVVKPLTKITRLWRSGLLKYTSAACFILVSAFGLYLNQQSFQKEAGAAEIANEQMLYDINEQDIIDHIQGVSGDKQTVSNIDLESYLLNNYSQNELSSAL